MGALAGQLRSSHRTANDLQLQETSRPAPHGGAVGDEEGIGKKRRMIIPAKDLEHYERFRSGYKRGRSSYKGCSGPRSGFVYEAHLLARYTPVRARPALHPHSRQQFEAARISRINEQVYVGPWNCLAKAERVGPTQSRGDGRLSVLNRHSFCREQKRRNHGRTVE
jgi:hypothetical protein